MAPLSATHVTPHFTRVEMRYDATPAEYRGNLEELAWWLESMRAAARRPWDPAPGVRLAVGSTWRAPESNAELPGASSTSQHLVGRAADFRVLGIPVAEFLRRLAEARFPLRRAELIAYPFGAGEHVHAGLELATKPLDTVLLQTSQDPARPLYLPVSLADSSAAYAAHRELRRRGSAAAVVLLVLAALVFLVLRSHT